MSLITKGVGSKAGILLVTRGLGKYISTDYLCMTGGPEEIFRMFASEEETYKIEDKKLPAPAPANQVFPLTFPIRFYDEAKDNLLLLSNEEETYKHKKKGEQTYKLTDEQR